MSYQGVLGAYPFTVSSDMVNTFRNLRRDREIVFAEHKVVAGLPKLQHTGRELDTVGMNVLLQKPDVPDMSVDGRILALRALAKAGIELPLVLNFSYFGMFVILNVNAAHVIYHSGMTWRAEVDLELKEYN